ncbi:hypothetical protein N7522_009865 [Penicillium canescens]|nr:hypothetical protein N7522_009865 [Penicillium canescens]
MSNQNVIRLTSPEPIPTAGKHEVLIAVKSVALNFRDNAIATGKYPFPVKKNVVPGSDAAGDVVETGEGVSRFKLGDKGNGLGGPVDGVLREYISVPAQAVVKIPENSTLSYAQWASVNSLYGNNLLKHGQTVLFQGTGGVSITGLMLAKAAGAKIIITSSSDEKLQHVKAQYDVDYTAAKAQKVTGGQGVDFILENGGSGTIKQSLDAIAYGGVISVIGFLSAAKQEEMPNVAGLALAKGAVVRGIMVGSKQQIEDVTRFIGTHNLSVAVQKTFKFGRDQVVKALNYLASAQHIGKVCINV